MSNERRPVADTEKFDHADLVAIAARLGLGEEVSSSELVTAFKRGAAAVMYFGPNTEGMCVGLKEHLRTLEEELLRRLKPYELIVGAADVVIGVSLKDGPSS